MNKKMVGALYRKEMTDILRDKKTILMMIVVPLILYPLIFIGTMWITTTMLSSSTRETFKIGFDHLENALELKEFFTEKGKEYDYDFSFEGFYDDTIDMEEELKEGRVNAYLTLEEREDGKYYVIVYNSADTSSATAKGMAEDMLKEYREKARKEVIRYYDLSEEDILYPVKYSSQDVATSEETAGMLFGYIVPFLLVSGILMGAMYPAIDVTAGEKERGTLETLLTLPVKNLELITGKFLATSTVAVFAALLNVLSMAILGGYFYASMQASSETSIEFDISVYIPAVLLMLLLAVVLAFFASATCLCVCIFAKSFKEAQNYTTPVMVVFLFASMASMLPNMKLENGIELIPIVNVVVLISELFQFRFIAAHIAAVFFSNMAYSIFAVFLMAKMFDSEQILFGESTGGIHFLEKRSQMKEKQIPGIGDVILLMAVLIVVLLLAGSLLTVRFGIWGLMAQQLLLLLLAFGYACYIKADIRFLFRLRAPKPLQILAALLCWFGIYVAMMLLSAILSRFFPESAGAANDMMEQLWKDQPFLMVAISSALLPAVCEEAVFRGFLFGTLSRRYRIVPAILWTGLLFGAYHMNLVKLFVVGLLGMLLAYLAYQADSIWVPVTVHFMNNLFAVVVTFYKEPLGEKLPFLFDELADGKQAVLLLLSGAVSLVLGIFILRRSSVALLGGGKVPTDGRS